MRHYSNVKWMLTAAVLCSTAGCISPMEYNAMARSNLQMQDKLTTSQAEKVKARTQVAMLRQEVLAAKQAQEQLQEQVDATARQRDGLQAKIDVQAEVVRRQQNSSPQSQAAVSLSPDTLDKLIQRVQSLSEENNRLRSRCQSLEHTAQMEKAKEQTRAEEQRK